MLGARSILDLPCPQTHSKSLTVLVRSFILATRTSIVDSHFVRNVATAGGALYLHTVTDMTISRTGFERNRVTAGGGALYLTSASFAHLSDVEFLANTALKTPAAGDEGGGAVQLTHGSGMRLIDCNASAGVAACGGFAYLMQGSNMSVAGSRFTANTAMTGCVSTLANEIFIPGIPPLVNRQGGGAIFMIDDTNQGTALECMDSKFSENRARGDSNGGALAMTSSEVRLTDTVFDRNLADQNGGAIAAKLNSHISLIDGTNRFSHNEASNGGAIYLASHTNYTTISSNSLDTNHTVTRGRKLSSFAQEVEFSRELEEEYSYNYTIEFEYVASGAAEAADVFEYNNASKAGPALFWNHDTMLYEEVEDFERSTRIGNTALYGLPELAASTPAQFINATHAPGIVETSGGRISGMPGPLKAPIVVVATDYYGNPTDLGLMGVTMILLNPECRAVNILNENPCTLTGDLDYGNQEGEVTYPSTSFHDVQITLKPNISVEITVSADTVTPEGEWLNLAATTHDSIPGSRPSQVHPNDIYLGSCQAGDRLINDNTVCDSCNIDKIDVTPEGANVTQWQYPANYGQFFCLGVPGAEGHCEGTCEICSSFVPNGAGLCFGDAIDLSPGYWRGNPASQHFIRPCLRMATLAGLYPDVPQPWTQADIDDHIRKERLEAQDSIEPILDENTLFSVCPGGRFNKTEPTCDSSAGGSARGCSCPVDRGYDPKPSNRDGMCWPISNGLDDKTLTFYQGQLCVVGHTGPMCGVCADEWLMDEMAGHCIQCPPGSEPPMEIIVPFVAVIVLFAVIAKKSFRKAVRLVAFVKPFIKAIQKKIAKLRVKAKIIMTYYQIISQYMGGILSVEWPPMYSKIAKYFDILNLNVVSLASAACVKPSMPIIPYYQYSYYNKLVMTTTMPLFICGFIFLFYVVKRTKLMAQMAMSGAKKFVDATQDDVKKHKKTKVAPNKVYAASEGGLTGGGPPVVDDPSDIYRQFDELMDELDEECGLRKSEGAPPSAESDDTAAGPVRTGSIMDHLPQLQHDLMSLDDSDLVNDDLMTTEFNPADDHTADFLEGGNQQGAHETKEEDAFDAMDLNQDGVVDASELMAALDTNKDGKISREEFEAGSKKMAPEPDPEAEAEAKNEEMDEAAEMLGGDAEMMNAFTDMGAETDPKEAIKKLKGLCQLAVLTMCFIIFPSTSLTVFKTFACDTDFDNGDGFLRSDYGLQCMKDGDYQPHYAFYMAYAGLMVLVYPLGIPFMYFVLVHVSRHDVNPDPLEVLEDCITGMTGGKSRFELTDEIRALAYYSVELRRVAEEAKTNGQLVADDINKKLEEKMEAKKRAQKGSRMGKASAFLEMDEVEKVEWEAAAPGFALAYTNIQLSLEVLDRELCHRYRATNPDVKGLAFLYEAYEPRCYYFESLECLRRLALTGMLIFISDGTTFQIAAGATVALGCFLVYAQEAPFMDDDADALATVAQMSTFTQLFFALLIATNVLAEAEPPIPDIVVTTLMLIANIVVMVSSFIQQVKETAMGMLNDLIGEKVRDTIAQVYAVLKETYDFFFPPNEEAEKVVKQIKRTPEQILKFVIFRQKGRKVTDVINISTGGPAIEQASGAASKWMKKGLGKKADFGATPGQTM